MQKDRLGRLVAFVLLLQILIVGALLGLFLFTGLENPLLVEKLLQGYAGVSLALLTLALVHVLRIFLTRGVDGGAVMIGLLEALMIFGMAPWLVVYGRVLLLDSTELLTYMQIPTFFRFWVLAQATGVYLLLYRWVFRRLWQTAPEGSLTRDAVMSVRPKEEQEKE